MPLIQKLIYFMPNLSTAIHFLFTGYTLMLFARVIGSWFPNFQQASVMRFVNYYTDPYLGVFKRFVPRIGMLDLSPLLAFIALRIIERIVLGIVH